MAPVSTSVPREHERLFVRVDATPESGLGHCMRCLALAEAWQDHCGPVTFIGRYTADVAERLEGAGVDSASLPADASLDEDLAATLAVIPAGAAIVLDGYGFDPGYQQGMAGHGRLLMIDDMGKWPAYFGELLLNQNPAAAMVAYRQAPVKRLLGPEYALLDRTFTRMPRRELRPGPARRWLVTMGGADADNFGGDVCAALCSRAPDCEIRLVVGPLNPHVADLETLARTRAKLTLDIAPRNICDSLSWADLAISAAGTTSLQLARLGVPALLIAIADNQVALGRSLDAAGAAVYLGAWPVVTAVAVAAAAAELSADASKRASLRDQGQLLVDGKGAVRVCEALAATAHAMDERE